MRKLSLAAACGAIALFGGTAAQAATVMSTLPSTPTGEAIFRSNIWYAHQFYSGIESATVRSIVVDHNDNYQENLWAYATVSIYDASGANAGPGNKVADFPFSGFTGSTNRYAVMGSATSEANLVLMQRYWVAFTATSANIAYTTTSSPVFHDPAGIMAYNFVPTTNGGPTGQTNYQFGNSSGGAWTTFSYDMFPRLELSTSPVPEPTILGGLGLVGGALLMRRHGKTAR